FTGTCAIRCTCQLPLSFLGKHCCSEIGDSLFTGRCSGWLATSSCCFTRNQRCSGHSALSTRRFGRTSRDGFRALRPGRCERGAVGRCSAGAAGCAYGFRVRRGGRAARPGRRRAVGVCASLCGLPCVLEVSGLALDGERARRTEFLLVVLTYIS